MSTNTIKRFYKDRLYIGIRDHEKDSWGEWQNILSAKIFKGKPTGLYQDEMIEFTFPEWQKICDRIKQQATELGREYALISHLHLVTSYPIWANKLQEVN